VKILAVSDVEVNTIYSPAIAQRYGDVDVVISCGDLPYGYLEYIISMLDKPLYFVRGNHANAIEYSEGGIRRAPWGGKNLHQQLLREDGLLLAGIQGSLRYNNGPFQYSQGEMWSLVLSMAPRLMLNRLRFGRFLDVFVSHAPPYGIHDMDDRPHTGIKAFNWLIDTFHPVFHLHGHIHVYRPDTVTETLRGRTRVVNVYGHKRLSIDLGKRSRELR
jgi:Icc-related predicted phosphoesterase